MILFLPSNIKGNGRPGLGCRLPEAEHHINVDWIVLQQKRCLQPIGRNVACKQVTKSRREQRLSKKGSQAASSTWQKNHRGIKKALSFFLWVNSERQSSSRGIRPMVCSRGRHPSPIIGFLEMRTLPSASKSPSAFGPCGQSLMPRVLSYGWRIDTAQCKNGNPIETENSIDHVNRSSPILSKR